MIRVVETRSAFGESYSRTHCNIEPEFLKTDLREVVRGTVEGILNGLLEEETDDWVNVERHERAVGREINCVSYCDRKPATVSGKVISICACSGSRA